MSDQLEAELPVAIVRTTDRGGFKRCRRRWGWSSQLRQNLGGTITPSYFWIGTGGHFSLEDYHGYNRFQHPVEAFRAYVAACRSQQQAVGYGLPDDWEEQTELAEGILEHYLIWLRNRDDHKTVWVDGEPQVEVTCLIELPLDPPPGYSKICYQLTLDRLVEIDDEYWITDYKFYKAFGQGDIDFDPQMSAYIWGAQTVFDKPIAGAILHEFKKALSDEPKILGSGKLSTAKHQKTTHALYKAAMLGIYGSTEKAPTGMIKCLNELAHYEQPESDSYIRRSKTRRTPQHEQAEGSKILMEATDMCNPDLPLYPNPTRDCSWDCSFKDVCYAMDRDDDWETLLNETTVRRDLTGEHEWRSHLELPPPTRQR